jgi:hypothetical protein
MVTATVDISNILRVQAHPSMFQNLLFSRKGEVTKFITIKRNHIHPSGEDKYGHWWIETNFGESYGWWPKYPVGLWETLSSVDGELNGQTSFGGTATKDPHHGDRAEEEFHPKISTKSKYGTLWGIIKGIRMFANNYSGSWSWPWGQNCQIFQKQLMEDVGLEKP